MSERGLTAVLDNAATAICLIDERNHCVYMNAAAEILTGYNLAETGGRPLYEVVHHNCARERVRSSRRCEE